jgi:L-Ala-D/L-Glu epimerase
MMKRIATIQSTVVETPMNFGIKTTYGSWASQPHVIVKLTTEEGISGFGESSPLGFFTGETAEMVKMVIDTILSRIILGRDPFDIESILEAMDHELPKNMSSKVAIDMALYDLMGKVLGVPAYRLLGGRCREKVFSATAVGIGNPDQMKEEAKNWVEKGFTTLKVKIGIDPRTDLQSIKAIREAVGDEIRIRVDANQGYSPSTAIQVGRSIEQYGIEYIEQPVPAWNIEGLAQVRRALPIPVMADESLYTLHDALRLIRAEAVDLFGIKMIKTGGLTRAKKIAHLAEAAGIECVVISPIETTLGTAAGAHWAMSVTNANRDHELVGPIFIQNDPFTGVQIEKNVMAISEKPGLGVTPLAEDFLS